MFVVIVTLAFLHSHTTVHHVLDTEFGYPDKCKAYIDGVIHDVQKRANDVFPERVEVTLTCSRSIFRKV